MKKLLFITFLVTLSLSKGLAQNIDSLKLALKNAKNDTTKVNILSELSDICEVADILLYAEPCAKLCEKAISIKAVPKVFYLKHLADALNNIGFLAQAQGDIPKALEYCHKSLKIQEEIKDKEGIARSLGNIGAIYDKQGDLPKALEYYHKSLKIQEEMKDKKGIANSLNNIGAIYQNQGDISKALDYHHKSLQLREEIKDKFGIVRSLINIGSIYDHQGDIPKALEYYHKSLKISEELKDKFGIAYSLNNIGVIYHNQGNLSKALDYFHKSLKIQEEIKNKDGIAISLINIGNIYNNQGDPSVTASIEASLRAGKAKALEYYHKSLQLQEETKNKRGIAFSLSNIASAMLQNGRVGVALGFATRSLQTAKELGYPEEIKRAAGTLKNIYKKQNKYAAALEMYELEIQMRDSINNEATKKASIQKQFQYEYEKQTAADSIKNAEQQKVKNAQLTAQKAELKQEKTKSYALYGGLALVMIFAGFMVNRFRVTNKQNEIITHQKKVVEEKHKEITDSINYAERIQRSFLATTEMLDKNLKDYFVFYRPKAVVSGDFYWASELKNGKFAFSVADSTGHGVPGAIMSILNISSLEKSIEKETEPDQILNKTRKIIIDRLKNDGSAEGGKDGMDCSLLVLNKDKSQLTFAASNNPVFILRPGVIASCHPEPVEGTAKQSHPDEQIASLPTVVRNDENEEVVVRNDGSFELLEFKPDKIPVGKHDKDQENFTLQTVQLQKGDIIYSLTDGFTDQFGGDKGKKYMIKNLKEFLLQIASLPMQEQEQKLADEFDAWKGKNEQVDDVCIIGVRI